MYLNKILGKNKNIKKCLKQVLQELFRVVMVFHSKIINYILFVLVSVFVIKKNIETCQNKTLRIMIFGFSTKVR